MLEQDFRPPWPWTNGHFNTIFAKFSRDSITLPSRRERINTEDGDFIDLDWYGDRASQKVIVLCHGLEGNGRAEYIRTMALGFVEAGWSAVGLNFRGCSGEMNKRFQMYHSGETEDLRYVIRLLEKEHSTIALTGFSLGGNVALKYLGEEGNKTPVKVAAAISVPLDLTSVSKQIGRFENSIYNLRFLQRLKQKAQIKDKQYPGKLKIEKLSKVKKLSEFDDLYTAPSFGFKDSNEYYKAASSLPYLKDIRIPTRIINAKDDPLLTELCYPFDEAEENHYLNLIVPDSGGHCGFGPALKNGKFWVDQQVLKFCMEQAQ
jgi:predicted alpha/beta-fold hydrolase